MRVYRAPKQARRLPTPPFPTTPGPPRDFREWVALRRWGKLPAAQRNLPGYLLRLARQEAGLTQKELAGRLGVTQPAVVQAERYTSNPTAHLMRNWAAACGRELSIAFT